MRGLPIYFIINPGIPEPIENICSNDYETIRAEADAAVAVVTNDTWLRRNGATVNRGQGSVEVDEQPIKFVHVVRKSQ